MHPNERRAKERSAAEPRFPLLLSVPEARVLLDWGLSEEAISAWMDWLDDALRARLVAFVEEHGG